jgi:hypothetical protein
MVARVPIGSGGQFQAPAARPLGIYLCPSDSTGPDDGLWPIWGMPGEIGNWSFSNYAANYQVFANADAGGAKDIPPKESSPADHYLNQRTQFKISTIEDGSSKTIFFAERFRECKPNGLRYATLWAHGAWNMPYMPQFAYGNPLGTLGYKNNTGVQGVVGPDSLFQTVPPESLQCNPMMTQAIHAGGVLLVGMGDASVRAISSGASGEAWWAAVTPSEGEVNSEL